MPSSAPTSISISRSASKAIISRRMSASGPSPPAREVHRLVGHRGFLGCVEIRSPTLPEIADGRRKPLPRYGTGLIRPPGGKRRMRPTSLRASKICRGLKRGLSELCPKYSRNGRIFVLEIGCEKARIVASDNNGWAVGQDRAAQAKPSKEVVLGDFVRGRAVEADANGSRHGQGRRITRRRSRNRLSV